MNTYALYLESGPRKQKTMVHVVELLGCVAKGPTTDGALVAAPDAIRAYLRFLKRHGEPVDPRAEFKTKIAEHVTKGQWLGNGDPALAFAFDLKPLSSKDAETYIRRLEWSRAEVLKLVDGLTPRQLEDEPKQEQGRSIRAMLEHVLESEHFYLWSALGKVEGLPAAGSIVKMGEGDLLAWMSQVRHIEIERIRALTPAERAQTVEHWQQTWTTRKALRRMLEHEMEDDLLDHLVGEWHLTGQMGSQPLEHQVTAEWVQNFFVLYGETLGLPVAAFISDDVGWMEFGEKDGARLAITLWRGPDPVPPKEGGATVVFEVEDVYQAVAELRRKGVKCDEVEVVPEMVAYATFYDPEGNRFQVAGPPPAGKA